MKGYVYFAIVALAGCAYGVAPYSESPDAGAKHLDAGVKDAKTVDAAPQHDASDPPDVVTACTLALPTGSPSCDSCLGASCCSEDDACGLDQDCMAFDDCLYSCVADDGGLDTDCESTCETTYPNGASELIALDDCMEQSCATDCQ